jgi:polyphosphate kinase
VIDRYWARAGVLVRERGDASFIFRAPTDERNLDRRVVKFPVLMILTNRDTFRAYRLYIADNVKAHALVPDGTWRGGKANSQGEKRDRAQEALYEVIEKRKDMSDREPQRNSRCAAPTSAT